MNKRTSIYLGADLARCLDDRVKPGKDSRSTSGMLNAVADRYTAIVRRSMPTLPITEWCLLVDSLRGVCKHNQSGPCIAGIIFSVSDAIAQDALDARWNVDGPTLLTKLSDMSFCQLLAIVDSAERFWLYGDREDEEYPELVAQIVGKRNITD